MFKVLKNSVCLISVFLTLNSIISGNNCGENNYEVREQVCGSDSIYCSESNVCLKIDCVHEYLIGHNKYHRSNDYCPPQTNYCSETDECLPKCRNQTTNRENRHILKSKAKTKNNIKYYNRISNTSIVSDKYDSVNHDEKFENMNNRVNTSKSVSAQFSPTYDSIWISFESLLEPQGMTDCSLIFEAKSLIRLGENAECHIVRSEILIILRKNATIIPNDKLTFDTGSRIKQIQEVEYEIEGNQTDITAIDIIDGTVIIDWPIYQSLPCLTINGIHQTCNNKKSAQIVIDNVIGNSGQPFKLLWSVQIIHFNQLLAQKYNFNHSIEAIKALLPNNVYNQALIEIDNNLLIPNTTYKLSVIAENRFGIKSLSTINYLLRSVDRKNFVVNVNGLTFVDISIDNMFIAELTFCNYTDHIYFIDSFEFVWTLKSNDFLMTKQSTDIFYISANTLVGGKTYRLTVNVINLDNNQNDSYSHEFETLLEPLIALINANYLTVGEGDHFTLDGSASYDPSNSLGTINYQWICYHIKREGQNRLTNIESEEILSSPVLKISSKLSQTYLGVGDYNFTLTISKGNRKSSVSIIVTILSAKVPKVHLANMRYENRFQINPNKPNVLTGFVTSDDKTVESWQTDSNLQSILQLTDMQKLSSNKMRSIELKIPEPYSWPNWYGLHTNKWYNFTLISRYVNERDSGFSTTSIKTNDPPAVGLLKIEPEVGIALHQMFTISTFGWSDADYPLEYKFYYKYPNETTVTHLAAVIGLPNIVKTILPGFGHQTISLTVGVKVCDKYEMCSIREATIQIIPNDNLSPNYMQFINKNSNQIKTISIIRAFMQTANSITNNIDLQQKIALFFQDFCEQVLEILRKSDSNSKEFREVLQSIGETLTSTLPIKFVRGSTLQKIISFKNDCFKQFDSEFEKIAQNSVDFDGISTLLLIDDFIVRSDKYQSISLLKDLQTYHSLGCLNLENPMTSHEIKSNLIYYRVDYRDFTSNNKNANRQNFIPIAAKVRHHIGSYLSVSENIAKLFMDWKCGKSAYNPLENVNCFGICIATAELNFDQTMMKAISKFDDRSPKIIISPVIIIQLFSPITGNKVIKELQTVSNESISFIIPIISNFINNSNQVKTINCAHLNPSDNIWRTDLCETDFSSDTYLLCNCYTFGYFGALAFDLVNGSADEETTVTEFNSVTTTLTPDYTTTDVKTMKKFSIITITISIDADFDAFVGDNITSTKAYLINELTQILRIPKSMVIDLAIIRGSVLIKFNVSRDAQINELDLVNNNYTISDVCGKQYAVKAISSELHIDSSPPDDSNDGEESGSETSPAGTNDLVTKDPSSGRELSSVSPVKPEVTSVSSQLSTLDFKTSGSTKVTVSKKTTVPLKTTPNMIETNATEEPTSATHSTTTTTIESTTELNSIVSMTITIEGDYDTVVGGDKQQFLNDVKKQLANYLRVPLICIVNMDSKPGSIIVLFELIPSNDPNFVVNRDAIKAAKTEFARKIRKNQISIVDSAGITHKVLSSVDYSGDRNGFKTENSGLIYDGSYLILGLAIGAIVIMIVLIVVTACVVRSYMYRKYRRQITPGTPTVNSFLGRELSQLKQSSCLQEMVTTNSSRNDVSSANTIRMLDGITREGASSLGHYSYDSGVWLGTFPEPQITNSVPEPPNYLPPNEMEISIAPKPPPEVLNKLKKEWNFSQQNSISAPVQ